MMSEVEERPGSSRSATASTGVNGLVRLLGLGSFRGQFGDHFRVGDHFGVGIISGAVQIFPMMPRSE